VKTLNDKAFRTTFIAVDVTNQRPMTCSKSDKRYFRLWRKKL